MSNRKVITMGKIVEKLFFLPLYWLFLLVQIIIFIGEWTQRILIYPFLYIYRGINKTYLILKNIKISAKNKYESKNVVKPQFENYSDPEKKQPISTLKIDYKHRKPVLTSVYSQVKKIQLSFISVLLFPVKVVAYVFKPRFELKTSILVIISFLSALVIDFFVFCTNFVKWFFKFSLKGSYTAVKSVVITVLKIPLYLFYFIKEVFYFIYSIFIGIVRVVLAIYRYITGPYFRSFIFGFIFCFIIFVSYQGYNFVINLPSPTTIGKVNFAQSTHLFDRNGKLLYEIYRDVNRTSINVQELPKYVVQATIAIEDKNFYHHKGISFFGGILRAARDTLKTNELQGGSTITQQLVKSALLSPERTVERKLKEIALAVWTEQIYSKDQIMGMYLNQVPYGGSAYGIEEASKVYFGKSAKDLSLSEASLLAGLPQAPSIYSPFMNPKFSLKRRNDVIDHMYEQGYITKDQRNTALAEKINILDPETNIRAAHFVFFTRSELEKEFGTMKVEEGGFRVTTTLDLDIQTAAQAILQEELLKIKNLNVGNGGIVVINPQNGEILAMVGSVDYFTEKYGAFNVTTALRQPGSALKPMLYAMAMERGFTAATPIDDSPIVFSYPGGTPYKPVNYDGRYHGRVSLRSALSNSYNIPAVKTLNIMGVSDYVDFARRMGIDTWRDPSRFGLALSLGGGEVTLLDLSQVYGVFASGGYRIESTPFSKIVDSKERPVSFSTSKVQVLDPGISYIISDILSDNVARRQAFGSRSALEISGHKVSVKTGTTDDKKDNLTVGYTPEFLVAVWVGNNDNTPMNQYLVSGITGAAPIWNRVMKYLLENKSTGVETVQKPENVIAVPCAGRMEYFLAGTEKNGYCFDSVLKSKQEAKVSPEDENH